MPIPVALIIATGKSDLKCETEARNPGTRETEIRWDRIPADLRKAHGRLWDADAQKRAYSIQLTLERAATRFVAPPAWLEELLWERRRENRMLIDAQDRLILQPGKIKNLLRSLIHAESELEVRRVLLLYTDREPPLQDATEMEKRNYQDEPVRDGQILGHWLAEEVFPHLSINNRRAGGDGITWTNYMQGLRTLEGKEGGANYPIYRQAVRAIDQAIAGLADGFDGHVITSTGGGFDAVKPIVNASAELHFSGRVYPHVETELDPVAEPVALTAALITQGPEQAPPAESLAARARVRQRLRQGDILGAWGVAAHIPQSTQDSPWLLPLEQLAEFFHGDLSAQVIPLSAITDAEERSLLLRAFQVETALQGERSEDRRIPDALIALTGLYDLALQLGLLWALSKRKDWKIQFTNRNKLGFSPSRSLQEMTTAVTRTLQDPPAARLFSLPDKAPDNAPPKKVRIETRGWSAAVWLRWLASGNKDHCSRFGEALMSLNAYLEWQNGGQSLRAQRNELAHRYLDSGQPARVIATAAAPCPDARYTPLWLHGDRPARIGDRFLGQPVASELFQAIGIDAAALYRATLGRIEAELCAIP